MQMKNILASAAALLLLSMLAAPADAQRGRGGHAKGHHGKSHDGYHGKGHHSGHHYGYSGRGGHRYGSYGYGGHQAYGGSYYGHPGAFAYSSDYRPYGAYAYRGGSSYYGGLGYYSGTSHYRIGTRGVPGVSIYVQAPPRYVVYDSRYAADVPSYVRYAPYVPIPENAVNERGEPYLETDLMAEPADARPQPARLELSLAPGDAAVYLDGNFLGLAAELPEELWVDPGTRLLALARPGFDGQVLHLEVEAGEELEVEVRLEPEAP